MIQARVGGILTTTATTRAASQVERSMVKVRAPSMPLYTCIYIYACTYVYVDVDVYMYIARARAHTHTHTHIIGPIWHG